MVNVVDIVVVLAEMTMDLGDLPGPHLIEEGVIILPGDHLQGEDQEGTGQGRFRTLLMLAQKGAMATVLDEVLVRFQ